MRRAGGASEGVGRAGREGERGGRRAVRAASGRRDPPRSARSAEISRRPRLREGRWRRWRWGRERARTRPSWLCEPGATEGRDMWPRYNREFRPRCTAATRSPRRRRDLPSSGGCHPLHGEGGHDELDRDYGDGLGGELPREILRDRGEIVTRCTRDAVATSYSRARECFDFGAPGRR